MKLLSNLAYQSVFQILLMIIPLVTIPYVSRVLGSTNIGIYSYTFTIAYYFSVFSMLGIEQYGNRTIAQERKSPSRLDSILSELILCHFAIAITTTIVYFLFVCFFIKDFKTVYYIQGIYLFSTVFDVNWFFWGMENYKITVSRNLVIKALTVLSIFCLVKTKDDLSVYAWILSLSAFVSQVCLWFYLPKLTINKTVFISSIRHIKPLFVFFTAIIAAHLYRLIDKTMLGAYGYFDDLGCYEYADKLIRLPLAFITAFGTIMLSRISALSSSRKFRQIRLYLYYSSVFVVFAGCMMAFGLASISEQFIPLFLGSGYLRSIAIINILSISIPLVAWNNFVRTQILIPNHKDYVYSTAVFVGAVVNFILNYLLIPHYKSTGAAVATFISYLSVLVIQTYPLMNFRIIPIRYFMIHVPFAILCGSIVFFLNRMIGAYLGIHAFTVVIQICFGLFLSVFMFFMYFKRFDPSVLTLFTHLKKL
ncbi:MAG: oligosaccharide flippase family protein [Lentisphaeria bacterium]|nr:oligosaccharide flippase family protein [Lentisphaeria bacterium]